MDGRCTAGRSITSIEEKSKQGARELGFVRHVAQHFSLLVKDRVVATEAKCDLDEELIRRDLAV